MEHDAGTTKTTTAKKRKQSMFSRQMAFWGSKEMHGLSDRRKKKSIQAIASKVGGWHALLGKGSRGEQEQKTERRSAVMWLCGVISSTFASQLEPHERFCAGTVSFDSAHRSVQSVNSSDKHLRWELTGDFHSKPGRRDCASCPLTDHRQKLSPKIKY